MSLNLDDLLCIIMYFGKWGNGSELLKYQYYPLVKTTNQYYRTQVLTKKWKEVLKIVNYWKLVLVISLYLLLKMFLI